MTDLAKLPSRLVKGAAQLDAPRKAAIDLLIWHGFWLRRRDFTDACIMQDRSSAWVRWEAAKAFAFGSPYSSTSELAILDLAVSLGTDRYKLSGMGNAHLRAIAQAWATAAGEQLEAAAETGPPHNHPSIIPGDSTCRRCALDAAEAALGTEGDGNG